MNVTPAPPSPAANAAAAGLSTYEEQRAQLDARVASPSRWAAKPSSRSAAPAAT